MKVGLLQYLFIGILLFSTSVYGQQTSDSISGIDTAKEIQKKRAIVKQFLTEAANDKGLEQMGDVPPVADSVTQSIERAAWQNYFDYKSFGYAHRRNVFTWQLLSSKIIFFVVIVLVLSGIYFAGLQFFHSLKLSKKGVDLQKLMGSELSASTKEIRVSSPVLGVIILVLSFLFFFLYLKYVYPIHETF